MNKKREMFIFHYIKCLNATQSAKLAGYSDKTSYSIGQRLLKVNEVSERIHKGIEDLKAKYNISRADYIKKTFELFENEKSPTCKQRYWELLGKLFSLLIDRVETKTELSDKRGKEIGELVKTYLTPNRNAT